MTEFWREFLSPEQKPRRGVTLFQSAVIFSTMSSALFLLRPLIPEAAAEQSSPIPTPSSTPTPERVYTPIVSLQETRIASGAQLLTPSTPTPTPTHTPTAEPTSTAIPTATETSEPEPEFIIPVKSIYTPEDTLAAIELVRADIRPRVRCITFYEVGRETRRNGVIYAPWNPNAIGELGELGAHQLHPRGLLPDFYKYYDNPFNPYQSTPYLVMKLDQEQGGHWAAVRLGLC